MIKIKSKQNREGQWDSSVMIVGNATADILALLKSIKDNEDLQRACSIALRSFRSGDLEIQEHIDKLAVLLWEGDEDVAGR